MTKAMFRLTLIGLSVFPISAIAAYTAVLNPLFPTADDSTAVTLISTEPDWVFDSKYWVTEAGGDVTANFFCQHEFGPSTASATASLGTLGSGPHTIHVWCWYDNFMLYIPEEVASLPVDIPSAAPLDVPAASDSVLVAQAVMLALGALLVRRRKFTSSTRSLRS